MAVLQLHGMLQMEVLFVENLTFKQEEMRFHCWETTSFLKLQGWLVEELLNNIYKSGDIQY